MAGLRLIFVIFATFPVFAGDLAGIYKTEDVLKQVVPKDKKLIILGDPNHRLESIRLAVAYSLPAFKKSDRRLTCLLLEADKRMQSSIDKFLADPSSSYADIQKARQAVLGESEYGFAGSEPLLAAAKAEQIKVYAIDIDFSSNLGKRVQSLALMGQLGLIDQASIPNNSLTKVNWVETIVSERNANFAKQVLKLMRTKACQRSLFVVGEMHISPTPLEIPVISVQRRLAELNVQSAVGSIVSVNCEKRIGDKDQDRICEDLNGKVSDLIPIPEPESIEAPAFVLPAQ